MDISRESVYLEQLTALFIGGSSSFNIMHFMSNDKPFVFISGERIIMPAGFFNKSLTESCRDKDTQIIRQYIPINEGVSNIVRKWIDKIETIDYEDEPLANLAAALTSIYQPEDDDQEENEAGTS